MIQIRGAVGGIDFLGADGLRPRIPRLSPTPLDALDAPFSGHIKVPRGTVSIEGGSACAGRFDHRRQGVRELLARTVISAPATAGLANQILYIPTSAGRGLRFVSGTVAGF